MNNYTGSVMKIKISIFKTCDSKKSSLAHKKENRVDCWKSKNVILFQRILFSMQGQNSSINYLPEIVNNRKLSALLVQLQDTCAINLKKTTKS